MKKPLSVVRSQRSQTRESDSRSMIVAQQANELVFGVVGHVGSGTSEVAIQLKATLEEVECVAEVIKASYLIVEASKSAQSTTTGLERATGLQDLGNSLRSDYVDPSFIATRFVKEILRQRAVAQNTEISDNGQVTPDGTSRAWILDSLRHPEEVNLLRRIYGDAFLLVGVVCEERTRLERLDDKFGGEANKVELQEFMNRDAKETDKFGQHVASTFHMSDYFVDNSEPRTVEEEANPDWHVSEKLGRLVNIVRHSEINRPTISETAMHSAYGSQLKSSCLSRQVGAALVDSKGQLISIGTNDVPRSGGGIYGIEDEVLGNVDGRCFHRKKYCSNTKEQISIVADLVDSILPEIDTIIPGHGKSEDLKQVLNDVLRKSRVGGLLEFSRAVHAEMDAILAAARSGSSAKGASLFVTTFPCHYCARHIVAAGITEVQYIEPYPKSLAVKLHDDSMGVIHDPVQLMMSISRSPHA